jgi:hypothetical protein
MTSSDYICDGMQFGTSFTVTSTNEKAASDNVNLVGPTYHLSLAIINH